MKLATTTGDVGGYFASKSIAAPLAGLVGTGFKHVDLSFYRIVYPNSPWISAGDGWKKEVDDCVKAAEKYGFDFVQSHAPDGEHFLPGESRDAYILACERVVEACGMLGIPNTVIHGGKLNYPASREENFQKKKEFYGLFEETAEKYNVDILGENGSFLWSPSCILNRGQDLKDLIDFAGLKRFHACWDTGHGNCSGADQYSDIVALGKELKAFHMQDNYGTADAHVMPMAGNINFDRVMQGIKAIDYQGCFTFEGHFTFRRALEGAKALRRKDVKPEDLLQNAPLYLQQKMLNVMYEVGAWMLETYGFTVE